MLLPPSRIWLLQTSILAILAVFPSLVDSHTPRWSDSLPPILRLFSGTERPSEREDNAPALWRQQAPVGVRRMSADQGEKFFLHYWSYGTVDGNEMMHRREGQQRDIDQGEGPHPANGSVARRSTPAFLLHSSRPRSAFDDFAFRPMRFLLARRANLLERGFDCPTGTSSCDDIDRPTNCCQQGQTCQLVAENDLGDVGCCDAGESCGGALSDCPSDHTSCPDDQAGGCCIPGYACVSGGCIITSTATVTTTPPSSITSISSIVTANLAPSIPNDSREETTTTTSCASGSRACPADLGGGCCPADRACGPDGCTEPSPTGTAGPPVRPTSNSPATTSETGVAECPDGFYACSAIHHGGCCRYGRDCAPTSCPTSDQTTLLDRGGITIAVPTDGDQSVNTVPTGDCAEGWSTCPPSDGGGCCLSGYECGSSCTATATDSGIDDLTIPKEAPNIADGRRLPRGPVLGAGISMALLPFFAA